jgi:hypothetical protein
MDEQDIKAALFTVSLPVEDYELPDVGTIKIRGLSRREAVRLDNAPDAAARDVIIFRAGIVEPALTENEIRRMMDARPAGELEDLSRRIAELSRLLPGADQEQYKSVRDESTE